MKKPLRFVLLVAIVAFTFVGAALWRTTWLEKPLSSTDSSLCSCPFLQSGDRFSSTLIAEPTANSLPNAADSDEVLSVFIRARLREQAPAALLNWLDSLGETTLRSRLRSRLLEAWGEADVSSASAWVFAQSDEKLSGDLTLILRGAMHAPEVALTLGRRLLAENAAQAGLYGETLITSLISAGRTVVAAQFAAVAPIDYREDWSISAYRAWAANQPREALGALSSLRDETLRASVFRGVAQGWSAQDPSALVAYAQTLPDGDDRNYALQLGVSQWSQKEPAALTNWLSSLAAGPERDEGIFLAVIEPNELRGMPDVALDLLQTIGDSALRQRSLIRVLGDWISRAPEEAKTYLQKTSRLSATDLSGMLQSFPRR